MSATAARKKPSCRLKPKERRQVQPERQCTMTQRSRPRMKDTSSNTGTPPNADDGRITQASGEGSGMDWEAYARESQRMLNEWRDQVDALVLQRLDAHCRQKPREYYVRCMDVARATNEIRRREQGWPHQHHMSRN